LQRIEAPEAQATPIPKPPKPAAKV